MGLLFLFVIFLVIAQRMVVPPSAWYLLTGISGVIVILLGIDHIRSRSGSETYGEENQNHRSFKGLAAIMDGIGLIVIGIIMVSFAIIMIFQFDELVVKFLKAYPGIAFVSGGIFLLSWSIAGLIGPEEEKLSRSFWLFLGSLPKKFLCVILILISLILLAAGIVEIVSPSLYKSVVQKISEHIPTMK